MAHLHLIARAVEIERARQMWSLARDPKES
jgi:hypothetical protein